MNTRFRPFFLVLAFLFLSVGGWALWQLRHLPSGDWAEGTTRGFLKEGGTIPPFFLEKLVLEEGEKGGERLSFQEHWAGRVNVFHFWATWCSLCMEEMPSLVQFQKQLEGRGVRVFSVNLDDQPEEILPPLKLPFTHVTGDLLPAFFQVQSVPTTVVLDSARKVLWIQRGPLDWNQPEVYETFEPWLAPLH